MRRSFLSRALIGSAPAATAPLEGLRTIFNYLVVSGHTHVFTSFVLDFPQALWELDPSAGVVHRAWHAANRLGVWASVDVFFFLSGFFLMSSLTRIAGDRACDAKLQCPRLRPLALVRYLASRWLRFAPVYLLVALIFRVAGEGSCIRLAEVLYMDNFYQDYEARVSNADACIHMGWSLQVDFQTHIAIGLLAVVAPSWQALMPILLALAGCSSLARAVSWELGGRPRRPFPALVDYVFDAEGQKTIADFVQLPAGRFNLSDPLLHARKAQLRSYTPWYNTTVHRGGVICVGAAAWLGMRDDARICRWLRAHPGATLLGVGATWAAFYAGMEQFYGAGDVGPWFGAYIGFGRLGLGLGLAALAVVTCEVGARAHGKGGGGGGRGRGGGAAAVRGVRAALGNAVAVRLGRVSYAVYLGHPLATWALGVGWPRLGRDEYTTAKVNWAGVKWYVASVVVCAPLCVVEEAGLGVRRWVVERVFGKAARGGAGREGEGDGEGAGEREGEGEEVARRKKVT